MTFTGGLTDDVGVIGKIGDELWPIPPKPFVLLLLFVFVLLLLWCDKWFVLEDDVEPWACFSEDPVDFVPPECDIPDPDVLLVLLLLFVLLFPDVDDVELWVCEWRVDDVEDDALDLFDDFKLFTFDDCWLVSCWRTFALRFLNQTFKKKKKEKKEEKKIH